MRNKTDIARLARPFSKRLGKLPGASPKYRSAEEDGDVDNEET